MRYDTHPPLQERSELGSARCRRAAIRTKESPATAATLYFCPGYDGASEGPLTESKLSGKVLRMDTQADFRDPTTYRVFDTEELSEETVCFDGGAFDGRYIYFVPLINGVVVQYDTKGDFADPASWRAYDARSLNMQMNVGAVFDGRYLYFCAYSHGHMIRYDTQGDFTADASWETFDAANTSGLDTGGFDGGFFDGCYVLFRALDANSTRRGTQKHVSRQFSALRYAGSLRRSPKLDSPRRQHHRRLENSGLQRRGL